MRNNKKRLLDFYNEILEDQEITGQEIMDDEDLHDSVLELASTRYQTYLEDNAEDSLKQMLESF